MKDTRIWGSGRAKAGVQGKVSSSYMRNGAVGVELNKEGEPRLAVRSAELGELGRGVGQGECRPIDS